MLTAPELKALLRRHGLRLTKRLGQNHLVDPRAIHRVLDRAGFLPDDTVLEIGAGLGALTEPLAARVRRVLAVEIDRGICALLRERLASASNVEVFCEDILDFPRPAASGGVKALGAIPYHVTSSILVWLTEQRDWITRAFLVVQREVAERLTARPGTKAYGRLSIFTQYAWEASAVLKVPRSAFYPQPAVDSVAIELVRRLEPAVSVVSERTFFEVVKAGFGQRRKTLLNCLLDAGVTSQSRAELAALLAKNGLPADVRGERLSLEAFARISDAFCN